MLAAKLILIYQDYWDSTVNLIFFKVSLVDFRTNIEGMIVNGLLSTFVIFLGVGVMEEFLKFWIMKSVGSRFFKSINDVIELAIISALGFAFLENIVYFSSQWGQLSTGSFFAFAIFRVTIVTMVHVLCSGILGYYYGMAYFASPLLKIQRLKQQNHPVIRFLAKLLRFKKSDLYHNEMLIIGLLSSMLLHALYDFALSIEVGVPIHIPVMILYFFGGFWYLSHLIKKKDLNLKLGLVGTNVMPKEDFKELMHQVQDIKEKMKDEGIRDKIQDTNPVIKEL